MDRDYQTNFMAKIERKIKMKINLKLKTPFLLVAVVVVIFALKFKIFADTSVTELNNSASQNSETEKKIKELEEKAEVYRKIIDLKVKQQSSLNNQISILDAEILKLETEMDRNKEEIANLNDQVVDLEEKIKTKEESIEYQKKILSELIQSYYERNKSDVFSVILANSEANYFMTQKDRFAQTGNKIGEMMKNIKSLRDRMENEKKSLEQKKAEMTDLHYELEDKTTQLEGNKYQKEILFSQTKGEEARYRELLSRVEAQKEELLNIDELYTASGLSVDKFDKPPKSSYASTSWYYSQKDSRWGSNTIGNSNTLMKNYGCAVTSISMIFTYHGGNIAPKTLAKQPIYYWDLIAWPKSWPAADVKMNSGYGCYHGNIDWKIVDSEIKKGNPVIIYIKKTNNKGGHYVVVHNKTKDEEYVVHDPYWGPNIYLDTTRALVGGLEPKSGTTIDQMIIYE